MSSLHTGVTFHEEDCGNGPFMIRIGGTSEFVSEINQYDNRCWPRGSIQICEGWDNSSALTFNTMAKALAAADLVWEIEGIHVSIEATH